MCGILFKFFVFCYAILLLMYNPVANTMLTRRVVAFLLLTGCIFITGVLRAQKLYGAVADGINEITLTPNGAVVKKSKFSCPQAGDKIFSIAVFHDTMYIDAGSKFYYTTGSGPGACAEIYSYTAGSNSLTADDNGVLYSAGNRVVTYNPHNKFSTFGDTMPFASVGDLAFFNGKLYMAAYGHCIVEVNLDNPLLSKKIMDLPDDSYGLAVSTGKCGSNRMYSFATGLDSTTITEIDIEHARLTGKSWAVRNLYLDAANPTGDEDNTPVTIQQMEVQPFCYFSAEPSTLTLQACSANGNPLTYKLSNGMQSTTGRFSNIPVGSYTLRIYSTPACFIDTTVMIDKEYCNTPPVVPTAFTPNHDGVNDILRPLGLISIKGVFTVYNRLGQKVFETGSFGHGWDGTLNGRPQPAGTYIWVLQYTIGTAKTIMQKGTTALLR